MQLHIPTLLRESSRACPAARSAPTAPPGLRLGPCLPCFAEFCRLPLLTGSISLLSTYTPRSSPTLTYPSPVPQPVFRPLPGFITFTCFKRRPNPKQPNMQNPSVAAPLSLRYWSSATVLSRARTPTTPYKRRCTTCPSPSRPTPMPRLWRHVASPSSRRARR